MVDVVHRSVYLVLILFVATISKVSYYEPLPLETRILFPSFLTSQRPPSTHIPTNINPNAFPTPESNSWTRLKNGLIVLTESVYSG
jgi:hypothetical protein